MLPVDCVASLERVSERSRPTVFNILLISSMLYQSVKCSKLKPAAFFLKRPNVETVSNHLQVWAVSVETPSKNERNPGSRFGIFSRGMCD